MPVSGVVIQCQPEKCQMLGKQIANFPGVEVHGILEEGKIVAVIEAENVQDEVDIVARMHELDGVATVRMAYHNFEDVA